MLTAKDKKGFRAAFTAALSFALFVSLALAFLAVTAPENAAAAEKKTVMFRGVKIKPQVGTYIVLRDVRIRAKPKTKSKKLGIFKAGRRIHVVGKAASAWVAVREKGKDVGFVYDQVLLPLIDGALDKDLTGRASVKGKGGGKDGGKDGPDCLYRIRFEGKSAVEGQVFEIADYDVLWDCRIGSRKVKFRTPMFITEAPFQMGPKRIFQISIDILDLDRGYDEIFSTIILFNQDKDRIAFDGVSIEKYGRIPPTREAPAQTVAEALEAAVKMALGAWNKAAWGDLIKNIPEYPDPEPIKKKPS